MTIRNHIEALIAVVLGISMVYFSVSSAQDTGYDRGYAEAKAEYEVLPIIKADLTPYKVRPMPQAASACPPAIIIQAPPEKIILDSPK